MPQFIIERNQGVLQQPVLRIRRFSMSPPTVNLSRPSELTRIRIGRPAQQNSINIVALPRAPASPSRASSTAGSYASRTASTSSLSRVSVSSDANKGRITRINLIGQPSVVHDAALMPPRQPTFSIHSVNSPGTNTTTTSFSQPQRFLFSGTVTKPPLPQGQRVFRIRATPGTELVLSHRQGQFSVRSLIGSGSVDNIYQQSSQSSCRSSGSIASSTNLLNGVFKMPFVSPEFGGGPLKPGLPMERKLTRPSYTQFHRVKIPSTAASAREAHPGAAMMDSLKLYEQHLGFAVETPVPGAKHLASQHHLVDDYRGAKQMARASGPASRTPLRPESHISDCGETEYEPNNYCHLEGEAVMPTSLQSRLQMFSENSSPADGQRGGDKRGRSYSVDTVTGSFQTVRHNFAAPDPALECDTLIAAPVVALSTTGSSASASSAQAARLLPQMAMETATGLSAGSSTISDSTASLRSDVSDLFQRQCSLDASCDSQPTPLLNEALFPPPNISETALSQTTQDKEPISETNDSFSLSFQERNAMDDSSYCSSSYSFSTLDSEYLNWMCLNVRNVSSEDNRVIRSCASHLIEQLDTDSLHRLVNRFNDNPFGWQMNVAQDRKSGLIGTLKVFVNLVKPVKLSLAHTVDMNAMQEQMEADRNGRSGRGQQPPPPPQAKLISYFLPRGTSQMLQIDQSTTAREIVQSILDRFHIQESVKKFSLCEHTLDDNTIVMRKFEPNEQPLSTMLLWVQQAEGDETQLDEIFKSKRFVLQENDNHEIDAELRTFIRILEKEEEEFKRSMIHTYGQLRDRILDRIEKLGGNQNIISSLVCTQRQLAEIPTSVLKNATVLVEDCNFKGLANSRSL